MIFLFIPVGVFPYGGFLVLHLLPQLNQENVGTYAGFIGSCFMIGRTVSSFQWGKASDKYGRKFTIKATLLLSAIFSILFGFAPNFKLALLFRFLLGLSNGIVGSVKTIISEMSESEKEETNLMALVLGMWGYGFLLSPAISGFLSDPVKQYPQSAILDGQLKELLTAYPFLLPNVIGCILCVISYYAVHINIEETLPPEQLTSFRESMLELCYPRERHALLRTASSWNFFKYISPPTTTNQQTATNLSLARWMVPSPSTSLFVQSPEKDYLEDLPSKRANASIRSLWRRKSTRKHLLVYWFYSFLVVSIDESFPLFCMSASSGLDITEKAIGKIFCGSGVCYICLQYFTVTKLTLLYGPYNSLYIGVICSIPVASLIPLSLLLNKNSELDHTSYACFVFLSVCYAWIRVSSSVVFSTITITTNKTVPISERASMNGLSMLGGSLGKALGPIFAGVLFATSVSSGLFIPPFGSVVVFSVIGFMGLMMVVQVHHLKNFVDENNSSNVKVQSHEDDQNTKNGDDTDALNF